MGLTQAVQTFSKTAGVFPLYYTGNVPRDTKSNLEILALHYILYQAGPRKGSACGEFAEKLGERLQTVCKKSV